MCNGSLLKLMDRISFHFKMEKKGTLQNDIVKKFAEDSCKNSEKIGVKK